MKGCGFLAHSEESAALCLFNRESVDQNLSSGDASPEVEGFRPERNRGFPLRIWSVKVRPQD